ncbi:cytochrome C [Roseibacterium sp. SDUM158017]|uniref:cytochrome C n=1 Tax=Roseicyclus salinarum TaxID=3036773 RepID=UPI002414DE25|nr:cytochrome C [Roseibacterium sp. SDUM158017]MDG4647330.1 cytochrome C [Roseibacterium sp. SDUM158017]
MRIPALAAILALVSLAAGIALTSGHVGRAQTPEGSGDADSTVADLPFTGEDAVLPFVIPDSGPFNPEQIEIANNAAIADWFRSAHADAAAEAFRHWDADEEIRPVCAVCHSGEGFRSFHGLDGSEPGIPETPVDTGGVVDCATCHNPGLSRITEIRMPSGVMHPVNGVEASCMTCHQGRTAGVTVSEAVAGLPDDRPDAAIRFVNPHYATAAATWLGGYGGAGYHYEGRDYAGRFFHARPIDSCVSCHQPHTLEVQVESCSTCHENGTPAEIRISRHSFDGSGDTSQGIREDIHNNADLLLEMVGRYGAEVAGAPILYDGGRYPYFFADGNADGVADTADGQPVAYSSWTPRMLRAAYNWKLVTADPGAYAHNPHYALQLLHDSVADLAGPLGVDMDDLGILR